MTAMLPSLNHPVPAAAHAGLGDLALLCKAAGDPLRLHILQLLGDGAFGVLELCQVFGIKQSSMSHHLKVLAQAGLASTQREGNSIFYRRPLLAADDERSQWLQTLFRHIDSTPADADYRPAVAQVLAERAQACAEFFARHADDFREQQDLIASHEQYGDALAALLASLAGKSRRFSGSGQALEIGPGEGALLPELARYFRSVTALDISPDMLRRSALRVTQEQLHNVQCVAGDTASLLPAQAGQYEFAVANMVLHHVPSPRTIFAEVARLLTPGGTLLITDLCRHEQAWARHSCGDLWLGFDPADLSAWATEAGLEEGQSQYSGLRNGFQIQFRLFHRPQA